LASETPKVESSIILLKGRSCKGTSFVIPAALHDSSKAQVHTGLEQEVEFMCFSRLISLDPGQHDGEGSYQGFADRNSTYFVVDQLTGGDEEDSHSDGDVPD
jgi:hypothetical protein